MHTTQSRKGQGPLAPEILPLPSMEILRYPRARQPWVQWSCANPGTSCLHGTALCSQPAAGRLTSRAGEGPGDRKQQTAGSMEASKHSCKPPSKGPGPMQGAGPSSLTHPPTLGLRGSRHMQGDGSGLPHTCPVAWHSPRWAGMAGAAPQETLSGASWAAKGRISIGALCCPWPRCLPSTEPTDPSAAPLFPIPWGQVSCLGGGLVRETDTPTGLGQAVPTWSHSTPRTDAKGSSFSLLGVMEAGHPWLGTSSLPAYTCAHAGSGVGASTAAAEKLYCIPV